MASIPDATGEPVANTLEHEFDLVRSAIALVSSGGAASVSLGSLHFGEQLIEPARKIAAVAHVRVMPIWSADEAGAGLAFERAADD
jgi:hypothetical protein